MAGRSRKRAGGNPGKVPSDALGIPESLVKHSSTLESSTLALLQNVNFFYSAQLMSRDAYKILNAAMPAFKSVCQYVNVN